MEQKTIYGNFAELTRFPLDCETIGYLQSNIKNFAAACMIAGVDKLILSGCELNSTGAIRSAGYVFIKDDTSPLTGNIIYHPEQQAHAKSMVTAESFAVTANNETFEDAYTSYYLKDIATGNIAWADFAKLSEISNAAIKAKINEAIQAENEAIQAEATARQEADGVLDRKIDSTNRRIDAMSGVPMGTVCMWSTVVSTTAPTGWAFCKGQYEMFSDGVRRKVPNMVGRFPMGPTTGYTLGSTGGAFSHSHTLTLSEMPKHTHTGTTNERGAHTHKFEDAYFAEKKTSLKGPYYGSNSSYDDDNDLFKRTTDTKEAGDHTHSFTTNEAGSSRAFSINTTPPYYVIEFIIKL